MRAALGMFAMLLWQVGSVGPALEVQHLRYQRVVTVPAGANGQACAVLDGDVFAHAVNASLPDVRLVAGGREVPFVVTESGTEREETQAGVVLDMGLRGGNMVLRVAMPKRPYTAVVLDLDAKDFVGSAHVFGVADGGAQTDLGTFPIFDLSEKHLSRSTTLGLQESAFPQLQIVLHLKGAQVFGPSIVKGVTVPPSREAQELFTTVAQATSFERPGHRGAFANLHVPAHVPVERTTFEIGPEYRKNFRADVWIRSAPDGAHGAETVEGDISRVKVAASSDTGNLPIDYSDLSVDTVLGANLKSGAIVHVVFDDANDEPLPVTAVRLEMRQRKICFDAAANAGPYVLMYGDETLHAPSYDYAKNFVPAATAVGAVLGAEAVNPSFVARQDARPYVQRHPELVWVGLLILIGVAGSLMLRGARRRH
jgi:hypothetical protein